MSTRQWHYSFNGAPVGPVSEQDLIQFFRSGKLSSSTMVWTPELTNWIVASSVDGLVPPSGPTPNPPPPPLYLRHGTTHPAATVYAGFWQRFAALLIDTVVVTVGGFVILCVFGYVYYDITGTVEGVELGANILGILLGWFYHSSMESSVHQGTLGKLALGIRVVDMNGARITFARSTGRYFSRIISGLILGIGYLMAAFTKKKQALHDIMTDCLVINK